jgi:hypothetical protein
MAVGQVRTCLRWHGKFKIPSSAAFGQIGDAYVKAIHHFAEQHQIPMMKFKKGQDEETVARPYLEAAREGRDRVVLIGTGQEKASRFVASEGPGEVGASAHGLGAGNGVRQPFLLLPLGLGVGRDLLETNAYAPFPIWLWLNGHEWAKRHLEHAGIPCPRPAPAGRRSPRRKRM